MGIRVWLAMLLLLGVTAARSEDPVLILSGGEGGSIMVVQRLCSDDNLYIHHDGSFENGGAWAYLGVVPPYDGAFGEAYALGPGTVECVSLWICQGGDDWYQGQSTDVYIWEGGVEGAPGAVLGMVGGVFFEEIPVWPDGGRYDVEIPVSVPGPFTAGSWGNWPGAGPGYAWLMDQDGPAGHPWTRVAEGTGFPPGWQDPEVVFYPIQSMGIGVHFTAGSTPVDPATWGEIKRLFAPRR